MLKLLQSRICGTKEHLLSSGSNLKSRLRNILTIHFRLHICNRVQQHRLLVHIQLAKLLGPENLTMQRLVGLDQQQRVVEKKPVQVLSLVELILLDKRPVVNDTPRTHDIRMRHKLEALCVLDVDVTLEPLQSLQVIDLANLVID